MTLTFVDASVLIAAARGTEDAARRAMAVLDDPHRTFASSDSVRLEVLPKAIDHGNDVEADFYRAFFDRVSAWAAPVDRIAEAAYQCAVADGLSAMDALHVAGAAAVRADELVTSEKAAKPVHRVTAVRVTTIHPGSGG